MKHTRFALLLLALSGGAGAETLRLEAALAEGAERSPRLQKARAAAEESDWRQTEALAGFLPRLSVNASHYLSTKYQILDVTSLGPTPVSIPQIYPTSAMTLDASLPLFDGLQNVYRYSSAGLARRAAEAEADWTAFQVDQDVRLRFYQAVAARKLEAVSSENVRTLEDHLNRVQALLRAGAATRYDVLRVEVQLHEAQSEALAAQDNVVLARARLAEAMGMAQDARSIEGELPVPEARVARDLAAPDFTRRRDLESAALRADAAQSARRASNGHWFPRLSLGGQYALYNNRTEALTDSAAYRNAYSVGLFLNWTFFDGAAGWARARAAEAQEVQAEKSAQMARLHAPTDFEFWRRRYVYSSELYGAKSADVEKARESVRLAQAGFRSGTRTTSEVLDAELDLFRAQAGAVNSQMGAAEARLNLELALGRKL